VQGLNSLPNFAASISYLRKLRCAAYVRLVTDTVYIRRQIPALQRQKREMKLVATAVYTVLLYTVIYQIFRHF